MKAPFVLLVSLCAHGALTAALPTGDISPDMAIVLLGDGTSKVVQKRDLASHLNGARLQAPADDFHSFRSGGFVSHQKRADPQFIIPLPDQEFLGWDIAMSSVTHANEAPATVAIAAGQSVANSVTVGASFTATVADWLQIGGHIDYQNTVTNTLTGTATMTIPQGRWGAIVSNPLTYRRRGYVFTGAPGRAQYEYFQADSFEPQSVSYETAQLNWVKGVITTCLGDGYPLKMCNGEGVLE
ncbi:hypothetical protein BDV28DRAFT_85662 [Aspergillus coremiiformis]|uniref:Alkaline phosphatase n=1 Tax=Aspergillus coremiiformis TaxID=138285 RepID=A0A5N6Z9K6_9EURO|nr:hypothetical protein BDV28DRAFT_85662 [Aspergillus coremiiformis]